MIHFVWYPEKEQRYEIETLSINRILNKERFYGKLCRKYAPKASPKPNLIWVNNPQQPLDAQNSFEI